MTNLILLDSEIYAEYDVNVDVYEDTGGSDPAEDLDPVALIKDQSGNGYDISQSTPANRPTYHTDELFGKPVIRGASGDLLLASTAADWKFLHDGSDYGIYMVWKTATQYPEATYGILDTSGGATANVGFSYYYNWDGSWHQPSLLIVQGSPGDSEAYFPSHIDGAMGAMWHVTAIRMTSDLFEMVHDGYWGDWNASMTDGSPSGANPTSPLAVGAWIGGTGNLIGDWARLIFINDTVTDRDHEAVQDYLAIEYGLPKIQRFGSEVVVQHDTSEPDHNAFPGLCVARNGDLVMAYGRQQDHGTPGSSAELIIRISADGGNTWSAEDVIWNITDDGGGTVFWADPSLTTLSNGDIFMSVGKSDGGVVVDGVGYFKSEDHGQTWLGPTQLTEAIFTDFATEGGSILELANGDLLLPYYGQNTGDGDEYSAAVLRSQNGGTTWSALAVVADGPIDGTTYSEMGFIQKANGDVLAIVREGPSSPSVTMQQSISDDNGATWGATTYMITCSANPKPLKLSTGEIILAMRAPETNRRAVIMFSPDDGALWQLGWRFADQLGGGQMTYGQFAEGHNGLYLVYGDEGTGQDVSDILFVISEYRTTGPFPKSKRIA